MSDRTVIAIENARFRYADSAWSLDVPSLHLGAERLTCIFGPNGSGKSSLLRLAAGLLAPQSGTLSLNGLPLRAMPRNAIARRIGFLPQDSPSLFDYTVEEVVRMGRYAYAGWMGALDAHDRRAMDDALEAVGLEALRRRPLSRLSGGERRRALIASVLAQTPGLFLLDEPTAALDLHQAVTIMRLLVRLGECRQAAVVVVTHDLNLAALFADRAILLDKGRILADGAPDSVLREELLRTVYSHDVLVHVHPVTGGPMIVARRHDDRESGNDHAH